MVYYEPAAILLLLHKSVTCECHSSKLAPPSGARHSLPTFPSLTFSFIFAADKRSVAGQTLLDDLSRAASEIWTLILYFFFFFFFFFFCNFIIIIIIIIFYSEALFQ